MIMTNEAGAAIGTATNPLVVSGTTVTTVTTVANSVAAASAASGGIALNGRLASCAASEVMVAHDSGAAHDLVSHHN